MKPENVSAIVPLYNEERTVAKVVGVLLQTPEVNEIVCVNDGSRDGTPRILRSFGRQIRVINFKRNRGKGAALAAGVRSAKGEKVVFLDGDLINLRPRHVRALLAALEKPGVRAGLGVPTKNRDGRYGFDLDNPYLTSQYLTGQRAYFRADLLGHLRRLSRTRYGAEVFLNSLHDKKERRILPLVALEAPSKIRKRSFRLALKEYFRMNWEIFLELGRRPVFKKNLNRDEELVET